MPNKSVSEATHTIAVGLIVVVHDAAATAEEQVPAEGGALPCTAPVEAVAASEDQRATIAVEAASGMEF